MIKKDKQIITKEKIIILFRYYLFSIFFWLKHIIQF